MVLIDRGSPLVAVMNSLLMANFSPEGVVLNVLIDCPIDYQHPLCARELVLSTQLKDTIRHGLHDIEAAN